MNSDFSNLTWLMPLELGLGFFGYLFMAACMYTIATKVRAENPWLAFIPLVNVFYMTHVAQKPVWWPVLSLIPCVNLVYALVLYPLTLIGLAEVRGKPGILGCLLWVPVLNWFVLAYIAFSD